MGLNHGEEEGREEKTGKPGACFHLSVKESGTDKQGEENKKKLAIFNQAEPLLAEGIFVQWHPKFSHISHQEPFVSLITSFSFT